MKCPNAWQRCGVGLIGILMILGLHDGSVLGLAPGISLLLVLLALKVLEMRTEREFMLLAYLAFFILLTSLFFSQTLLVCLYVIMIFVVLTTTIVQFTGGAAEGFRPKAALRYTAFLVLQAAPLIVLFFVFLPRIKGGSLLQINKPKAAQSGMSEQINPGSFAELALNDEPAFRVEFPDGVLPPLNMLYWRAAVFSDCQGLTWTANRRVRFPMGTPVLTGPKIIQRISMEPHGGLWAYGLDRPQSSTGPVTVTAGNVLTTSASSSDRLTIRVTSRLGNDRTPLTESERAAMVQVPGDVGNRSRALVDSWLRKTKAPRELIGLALSMFRHEEFRYTLSPGTYRQNGLDEFLFERKLGFCEHYAAAFSTLMRMAGLPTRMVAGYHGGEPNPFSDYMIVRQADAHAWTEVWIEGEGWVRFDPVESINPSRVDPDTPLASRFPTQTAAGDGVESNRNKKGILQRLGRSFRLGWDTVNFRWNLHVVSFDQESQRDIYNILGIRSLFSWRLIAILAGGILAVLAAVYFLMRQKPEKKDHTLLAYRRLCRLLARHGLERRPNEGPRDFATRSMGHFPEQADRLTEIFQFFIEARYGNLQDSQGVGAIHLRLQELSRSLPAKKAHRAAAAEATVAAR